MKTILSGHTSPETAYVVNDYPYGFRLRCQIRYWVEFKKNKGCRVVSQTSNPKRPGLVWNKPKAGTYSDFGAVLFLDSATGHVDWAVVTSYSDLTTIREFASTYAPGLSPDALVAFNHWHKLKEVYEANRQTDANPAGFPYQYASIFATLVVTGGKTEENARAIVTGMIEKSKAAAAGIINPEPVRVLVCDAAGVRDETAAGVL